MAKTNKLCCAAHGCDKLPLTWVQEKQFYQTDKGSFIAKISAWLCLKCGKSYGGKK